MSEFFDKLDAIGYSDCFYQGEQLWGFHNTNVIPQPIPREIIKAAESESTRDRLSNRLKIWCDRRGIPRPQNFS